MAIEVFWASGSPFSWRVMLALEVKGVAYESRLIQLSKRENRTPEFLALNPRGQVPTVRDGHFVCYESVAVIAYIDRRHPEPPLFGRTAEEGGLIWQRVEECVSYLDAPADAFILPLYRGQSADKEDEIRAALPTIHAELGRMEQALGEQEWLAAPTLSAADITAYPIVKSLLRAAGKPEASRFDHRLLPLEARYPAMARWMARIEALPGYDRTYPPHWRH